MQDRGKDNSISKFIYKTKYDSNSNYGCKFCYIKEKDTLKFLSIYN